jgi:osmotically inducible protein OsmC
MEHSALAVWEGSASGGEGRVTTQNGALDKTRYAGRARSANGHKATNTEELIAAAHAACYSIALSDALDHAGFPAERITTTATVTSSNLTEVGWTVTGILLDVVARVPLAKVGDFIDAAMSAKVGCSLCRLLNAKVSLNARMEK